jgi:putative hydroxymethylpyrimidine transport system substrate-binding protein
MRRLALLFLLLAAGPAHAADRLTVLLDWFVNPNHAPLLVAQQIGAYAAEGLDVELVSPADATMPPKLVAAGHGDIGLTSEPQFLEQVAAGLPLRRFGILIDRPLSTMVARRDAGIEQLRDLRGKRIGYGSGEVERAMVGAMLQTAGLSPADVQMIQIGEQLSVALLSRQVDAVTVYRNFEVLQLQQRGASLVQFPYEAHGVPDFAELVFVARSGGVPDATLARFLRATARGAAYLRAHPAACWTDFAGHHPELDDALNHASWFATIPYFSATIDRLDPPPNRPLQGFLASHGLAGAPLPGR